MPAPALHLTGESCAGVTTLGVALAQRQDVPKLDVDDVYCLPIDPPHSTKRPIPRGAS